MPPKYWIKLYHEILRDPKMCCLSDKLYRRVIELFLLAGENGQDGSLPDSNDISWHLRLPLNEVVDDLAALAGEGIIEKRGDEWFVTHFAKRQAPMPQAERMRRVRADSQQTHYYGVPTVSATLGEVRDASPNAKTEPEKNQRRIRIEPEEGDSSAQLIGGLFRLLESAGVVLTQRSSEEYLAVFEEDTPERVRDAIEHAKEKNVLPNPGWLRTVVLRCKRQNCKPGEWPKRARRRDPTDLTPAEQAVADEMTDVGIAGLEES